MAKNTPRRRASFGVIFWIAAILLITVLFLFQLPAIREVLDNTDFVEVVFEDRSSEPRDGAPAREETDVVTSPASDAPATTDDTPSGLTPTGPAPGETTSEPGELSEPAADSPEIEGTEEIVVVPTDTPSDSGPERTMRQTLFFIRVSDDGRIVAEPVNRVIRYSSGPLARTIETLIAGPSADDLNQGLLSLVPQGSRLISARVEDGVAYLNFNEAFRFNTMGLEGHLAQLQQVVLTATQFSTVDAVQIVVEGQVIDYLGGDGVYVGAPLAPEAIAQWSR